MKIVESSLSTVVHHLDSAPLNGKHIFITGGTGFFGLWLLSALLMLNNRGSKIRATVLSRDPEAFLKRQPQWSNLSWLSFPRGNVRDFDFPQTQFDLLIHAATDTSMLAHANPLSIFDDIVGGTRRVLDFAVDTKIKRVLLVSSGAVYGAQPPAISHIPDNAPFACLPQIAANAYGEGKRVMEMLGALYQQEHGIESIIARCFAFAGPGLPLDGHFAIGNFIRDALNGDAIQIKGDGTPLRSYLYGADLAVWLLNLLGWGKPCSPYNVGSDQSISIAELANLVSETICQGKTPFIPNTSGMQNEQRHQYVPAIDRAREELNLNVWTSLQQAIEWTAAFHKI